MNAVVDALRPFGITDIDMPATPERVWRALQGKDMSRATAGTVSYGGSQTASTGGAASSEGAAL
jgi:carbon-monoxide dehydrogenase large subunit